jgi:U3 small nucleolar RNA-associated protein 3
LGEGLEDAAAHSPPSSSMKFKAEGPSKKQRKPASSGSAKTKTKITPVFDLVEPTYTATTSSKKKKSHTTVPAGTFAAADPYGEATSLDHADLSDKHARKKSLRFHVSRIESSSSRRTNARVNAAGGDDDIPYRERRKAKEGRLEREREKKIGKGLLGMGGDDLDDVDPVEVGKGEKKGKRKRELGDDSDDDDDAAGANGYYDLIKQATAGKKAQKQAEYEAATAR